MKTHKNTPSKRLLAFEMYDGRRITVVHTEYYKSVKKNSVILNKKEYSIFEILDRIKRNNTLKK